MATPNFPSNAVDQIIDDAQLEAGCLYAMLTYGGEWGAWEWAFFVPKPIVSPIGREGTVFHVTLYTENDHPEWRFETDPAKDITASPEVVALIRLARVSDLGEYDDIVGRDGLTSLFKDVKIPSTPESPMDFSSRTWFTEAVGTLHDCAVVHCDDVWLLEREIKRLGFAAMDRYMENRGNNTWLSSPYNSLKMDATCARLDRIQNRQVFLTSRGLTAVTKICAYPLLQSGVYSVRHLNSNPSRFLGCSPITPDTKLLFIAIYTDNFSIYTTPPREVIAELRRLTSIISSTFFQGLEYLYGSRAIVRNHSHFSGRFQHSLPIIALLSSYASLCGPEFSL